MTCILSELLISIEWVVSPNDWCVGMSQTSQVNIYLHFYTYASYVHLLKSMDGTKKKLLVFKLKWLVIKPTYSIISVFVEHKSALTDKTQCEKDLR